MIDYGGLRV